jgi:hypothetical protein
MPEAPGTLQSLQHASPGARAWPESPANIAWRCEAPRDEVVNVFDLLDLLGAWGDCV